MPITTFEGKALVFNNGVVDVQQNGQSLVNEDKIAVIPQGNVDIDNLTIIENANNKLEVPIDNDTIYVDQDGFMKAKGGSGGSVVWGNIGGDITNQEDLSTMFNGYDEELAGFQDDISELRMFKQDKLTAGENITINSNVISATDTTYTAGNGIDIDANNVISATGGGGGSSYTAGQGITITDDVIKANSPFFSVSTISDYTSGKFEVTTDSSANPPEFTFPTSELNLFIQNSISDGEGAQNAILTLSTNLGDLYFRGVIVSVNSNYYFYGVEDNWYPVSKLGVTKPNMLAMYIPNNETVRSYAALEFRHGTVTTISSISLELEGSNKISTSLTSTSSGEPSYFIFNGVQTYPIKLKWMLDAIFADKFLNGDSGK